MNIDAAQCIGFHGDGVARRQKKGTNAAAMMFPGIIQIGNDIIEVLDTHAQPDEVRGDTRRRLFGLRLEQGVDALQRALQGE